jgi:hypothetical protein
VKFVRGDWNPSAQELVKPSLASKLCFLAALALTLMPGMDLVYVAIVGLFVSVKLSGILANEQVDPIKPIEDMFWNILKLIAQESDSVKND